LMSLNVHLEKSIHDQFCTKKFLSIIDSALIIE